jgi:hypothetical protein
MIFRLSQKLAKKIKVPAPLPKPLDPNPLVDWSAHVFTVQRTQFLLLTNTASLYSTVLKGRGISDDSQFIDGALGALSELMETNGQVATFKRFISPGMANVTFASALNRSITGSMNDLVNAAQFYLAEGDHSLFDVSFRLNDIPMSYLKYGRPRDAFLSLSAASSD